MLFILNKVGIETKNIVHTFLQHSRSHLHLQQNHGLEADRCYYMLPRHGHKICYTMPA